MKYNHQFIVITYLVTAAHFFFQNHSLTYFVLSRILKQKINSFKNRRKWSNSRTWAWQKKKLRVLHDHAVICYHVTLLKYFLQHQEGMGKWIRPLILILSSVAFIDTAFQLFKWRLYHCQTRHGFNRVSKI